MVLPARSSSGGRLSWATLRASLVPVMLTTLLAAAMRILDASIKEALPLDVLDSRAGGATASDSLCMVPFSGFCSLLRSLRLLVRFRQPLSFLGDLAGPAFGCAGPAVHRGRGRCVVRTVQWIHFGRATWAWAYFPASPGFGGCLRPSWPSSACRPPIVLATVAPSPSRLSGPGLGALPLPCRCCGTVKTSGRSPGRWLRRRNPGARPPKADARRVRRKRVHARRNRREHPWHYHRSQEE